MIRQVMMIMEQSGIIKCRLMEQKGAISVIESLKESCVWAAQSPLIAAVTWTSRR